MNEGPTKLCDNCKRDISEVNFTIHSVHCARNIKVCPVCKEPFPSAELQAHHNASHKMVPCKACGELVCGTDLEDHTRDSCALTVQPCRYCELELPRREMPDHESYCGSRTEQCQECKEYVMLKYKQLHVESNHGFIKLDDEPGPSPLWSRPHSSSTASRSTSAATPRSQNTLQNLSRTQNVTQTRPNTVRNFVQNQNVSTTRPNQLQNATQNQPIRSGVLQNGVDTQNTVGVGTQNTIGSRNMTSNTPQDISSTNTQNMTAARSNFFQNMSQSQAATRPTDSTTPNDSNWRSRPLFEAFQSTSNVPANSDSNWRSEERPQLPALREIPLYGEDVRSDNSGVKRRDIGLVKRTNDQPQVNMNIKQVNKVEKNASESTKGGVKKRRAPLPPADPMRDNAYWSALARKQQEENKLREQNAYNAANGLPPVLTPAAKLEKLRKMDALHNRETEDKDYKNKLQGRVWMADQTPAGYVLGSNPSNPGTSRDCQANNSGLNRQASAAMARAAHPDTQDFEPNPIGSNQMRDSTKKVGSGRIKIGSQLDQSDLISDNGYAGSSRSIQSKSNENMSRPSHNQTLNSVQPTTSNSGLNRTNNGLNQDNLRSNYSNVSNESTISDQNGDQIQFNHSKNNRQQNLTDRQNGRQPQNGGKAQNSVKAQNNGKIQNGPQLKPSEIIEKFHKMRMEGQEVNLTPATKSSDRFSDIKRELRELRRGLNEVTAPYNTGNSTNSERSPKSPRTRNRPAPQPPTIPSYEVIPTNPNPRSSSETAYIDPGHMNPTEMKDQHKNHKKISVVEANPMARAHLPDIRNPERRTLRNVDPFDDDFPYRNLDREIPRNDDTANALEFFGVNLLDVADELANQRLVNPFQPRRQPLNQNQVRNPVNRRLRNIPIINPVGNDFEDDFIAGLGDDVPAARNAMRVEEHIRADDEVVLPCEFCEQMVPAEDLVLHQTGCRPDLAQFRVDTGLEEARGEEGPPVIPCEFCLTPIPVSDLMVHQVECLTAAH